MSSSDSSKSKVSALVSKNRLLTTLFFNNLMTKETTIYYFRLVIWVGILFGIVTGIGFIPERTTSAMKSVICFAILLLILIVLKKRYPKIFEQVRWFCAPGNIFLKSWISLFFYVYLIRVPYDLASVETAQIVSWIFQCVFGDFLALLISGGVFTVSFFIVRVVFRKKIDRDEFDAVEEMRNSRLERIGSMFEKAEAENQAQHDLEFGKASRNPPILSNNHGDDDDDDSNLHPNIPKHEKNVINNPMIPSDLQHLGKLRSILEESKDISSSPASTTTEPTPNTTNTNTSSNTNNTNSARRVSLPTRRSQLHTDSNDDSITTSIMTLSKEDSIKLKRKSLPVPRSIEKSRTAATAANVTGASSSETNQVGIHDNTVPKRNRASVQVYDTLRDLGVGFSIIQQFSRDTQEFSDDVDVLTIERASCIKSEVRVHNVRTVPLVVRTIEPLTHNIRPFSNGESNIQRQSVMEMSQRSSSLRDVDITTIVPSIQKLDKESSSNASNTSNISNQPSEPQPFVPNISQLLYFWTFASVTTGFILLIIFVSHGRNIQNYVITFQFCATINVFIGCTVFRAYLTSKNLKVLVTICQSVTIFFPVVLFLVIFTSIQNYSNWTGSLAQYLTSNSITEFSTWGAGDLLVMLLAPAISSLSFSTIDSIVQYYRLMPLIIPGVWISSIIITIQGAALSRLLQSPSETGLPLLSRTVTTPVAVAISDITGASSSITAASTIINAITSYICAPFILTFFRVLNPVSRGSAAAVSGTLLGVLAVDENGEKIAAGIGMASYGLATLAYALIMAISGFRNFVINLSQG